MQVKNTENTDWKHGTKILSSIHVKSKLCEQRASIGLDLGCARAALYCIISEMSGVKTNVRINWM
jgi:DNA repair photolyase